MQSRGLDGAIESDERVRTARPVVEASERGARRLGERYWLEVRRISRGAVRARVTEDGVELRAVSGGPCLLRFAPPELVSSTRLVSCRFPIRGGLLARRPGGAITLSQSGAREVELRAAVEGFVPRLGSRAYEHIQRRLHVAVSRRFFLHLIVEAEP